MCCLFVFFVSLCKENSDEDVYGEGGRRFVGGSYDSVWMFGGVGGVGEGGRGGKPRGKCVKTQNSREFRARGNWFGVQER